MGDPIDPTPFEPYMPESVRGLIAEAREGRGAAAKWLVSGGGGWGQVGDSFAFLRAHPVTLPLEQLGWLVGIGMFGDELTVIPDIMERERISEPAPIILEAFAAGIRAGVPTMKRQWKSIERIAAMTRNVPDALRDVLPFGLVSDQALARGCALRLAQKIGPSARAAIEAARAQTSEKRALKRLDEALSALTAESAAPAEDDLLARLLAAYRETFDPALEAPIASLGADQARRRGPLRAKSKGELEGAWLALAAKKDPGDVDRLLGTPWPGAWKTALARVEALRGFEADPRIATALPKIETAYDSFGSYPLHRAAHGTAARHRGQKTADAPKELLAEAEGRTKRTIDIDAVWRAFREDPTDERRMVLADALQTLGDPRGEYIALSMAIAEGRADPAITKRAAQLLDANIDAWTGPLPGAERSSRRFERGFLAEVHLKTKGKKLLESVSAPEWATIEELHLEAADILEYHRDALVKLFESAPALRAFIAHSFGSEELLASLVGPFPRIRAFGARDFLPSAKVPAFPNLALVGTSTFWFGVDHALECASRVGAEVLLLFGVDDLAAAVEQLHQSKVPEARFLAGNRHVAPGRHEGWCVRVRRG
ncbi:MAG: hypothetical protein ACXWUG_12890, partial [Polyangiales bacterium]